MFHLCMMPNCCLCIICFSYRYLDDIRYSNNEKLHSDTDQTHIIVGCLCYGFVVITVITSTMVIMIPIRICDIYANSVQHTKSILWMTMSSFKTFTLQVNT